MHTFYWPVRIYYEDTDSGGVVYYANYLRFMERARTEWLRNIGGEQDRIARDEGLVFAVRSAQLEYLRPARFNDALYVSVRVAQLGGASLTFEQSVIRADAWTDTPAALARHKERLLCTGRIKIVCVDVHGFTPKPIPERFAAEINVGS